MAEVPKSYDPKNYEDTIYKRWEVSGFFNPDVCVEKGITDANASPFSIILPPPNVTGTLHIGHAAMLAIEDVMVRYHRMKGDRTLWVPGTDHAAIATQEKVEKNLWNQEKLTRQDLGREIFLKRVEEFAQDSHDTIVHQCKRMGTSMDWSREYYSLDAKRNLAVRTAFKKMYDEGLIYRGDRIVNWDPKMQSNVSDIEVVRKEEKAPFYYFQYGPFVIGTARPETKFGDKYVVMHPDDERYAQYTEGDTFECEWINGPITATIIKDASVDREFGSGVMTITPWHDANDFSIAERYGLDKEQVIDFDGTLLSIAGEFTGMHISEARPKIVEKLQSKGLVVKVDNEYIHSLATNSRGGGVIEPQIMKQWWVDVHKEFSMPHSNLKGVNMGDPVTLQKLMRHVVERQEITILPERFEKIYFNWVNELRDWCISRQIWYGHRVPVWYHSTCQHVDETGVSSAFKPAIVGELQKDEKGLVWCPYCKNSYDSLDHFFQDPDTLDTWFSAGLFSFSPLGWPVFSKTTTSKTGQENDFTNFHPTSVLETGYDILFFWVLRMVLMSTYILGEVPFKTVYLHGLVRDEHGNKMSKSLGNIIDPLDMAERYGTDATRLSLLIGSGPGADSRLSEEKIAGFRNFANKLWNIARFVGTTTKITVQNTQPISITLADKWILSRLNEIVRQVTENIEKYNFSYAGEVLRDFTWSDFADWYLEIAKIEGKKDEILSYILTILLKLWHPYMPFVTEAIWHDICGSEELLMVEKWPTFFKDGVYPELVEGAGKPDFSLVQGIITGIRATRAEHNIEPGKLITAYIKTGETYDLLEETAPIIRGLARVENLTIAAELEKPEDSVGFVERGVEVYIDLAGVVDVAKEEERLQREISMVEPYVIALEKKLSNKEFIQNAPGSVVEAEQKKLVDAKDKLIKLQDQLRTLSE